MNHNVDDKKYYDTMHRIGRWSTVITLLVFYGIPTLACMYFDIMPTFGQIMACSGALLVLMLPGAISEMISEVPILGSAYYLCNITGNVINLKLPCAINAHSIADVQRGTSAADAVAGIATAVSSLVTMLMLAVGVLLMVPLKPVLQSEAVTIASNYVLPALFGYLALSLFNTNAGGGIKVKGLPKSFILPFIIAFILAAFVMPAQYTTYQGFIILPFIPFMYYLTKFMFKKGMVKVIMPAEEK